jgi:hypothetical protein
VVSFAQSIFMRPLLIFLLLAGAGILTWVILARPEKKAETTKQQALSVSKHSEAFNANIAGILNDYNRLSEQFVNWDSANVTYTAASLIKGFDGLVLDELKKDSAVIYETAKMFVENAKGDLATIATEKTIRPQREAFNSLTDNFYQFLNTIKYDRQKLFLQECPMAFDDTKSGFWLSLKEQIRNPYLGLHHPTYGKGMLSCGETKIRMNNTGAE